MSIKQTEGQGFLVGASLLAFRSLRAVENVLLNFKMLCDSYSAALLELHSAWAVMFLGIWLANPLTDVVPTNPVLLPLGDNPKAEMVLGIMFICMAGLRMIAVRTKSVRFRVCLSLTFAALWFASSVMYLTNAPLRVGMALCPAYFVADAITYIRLSGQLRLKE